MPEPEVPRWQLAFLLAAVLVISSGVLAYSSTLPIGRCWNGGPARPCPGPFASVGYATEVVPVAVGTASQVPLTVVSFHGVEFRLWVEPLSLSDTFLQGTGTEPDGVDLTMTAWSNNSGIEGPGVPMNATVQSAFSPDGVFGMTWLDLAGSTVDVRLSVADPLPVYAMENVTMYAPVGGESSSPLTTVVAGGDQFDLQMEALNSLAGYGLEVNVTEANGTLVHLGLWAGPTVQCSDFGGTPESYRNGASCLESATSDHTIAVLWGGWLNVTLMERVG